MSRANIRDVAARAGVAVKTVSRVLNGHPYVSAELKARVEAAMAAGVARERIWLDPGIGFGKTLAHNLALTVRLGALIDLGFPVLYAASRKRTIQAIDPTATLATERLGGSLALALEGARRGARMVRVHDVRETVQALKVQAALMAAVTAAK